MNLKDKTVRLSIRLSSDDLKELLDYCYRNKMTYSDCIRNALYKTVLNKGGNNNAYSKTM